MSAVSPSIGRFELALVLRPTIGRENCYDVWYPELKGKVEAIETSIKFEVGDFIEWENDVMKKCEDPPVKHRRLIKRNENSYLLNLPAKFLKPEEEFFNGPNFPSEFKKYKKYYGLSPDIGPIFLNKSTGDLLTPGVLYDLEICNFALLTKAKDEKDLRIINVMKAINTLWLGGLLDKSGSKNIQIARLDDEELNEARDCFKKYGYNFNPMLAKQLMKNNSTQQCAFESDAENNKNQTKEAHNNIGHNQNGLNTEPSKNIDQPYDSGSHTFRNGNKEECNQNVSTYGTNMYNTTSTVRLLDTTMNITLNETFVDSNNQSKTEDTIIGSEGGGYHPYGEEEIDFSMFKKSLGRIMDNPAVRNAFSKMNSVKELGLLDTFLMNPN